MSKDPPVHRLAAEVSGDDHVRGSPSAAVTLVAYGDFACPSCAQTFLTVKKIQKRLGRRLRYVFRPFPQPDEYVNSEEAAEAAACAGAQGKFWEMHDRIFENEGATDDFQLSRYAKEIGLDLGRFRRELKDHTHLPGVRSTWETGVRSGVHRAPAFFINSVRHTSSFGLATLLPAVQAAAESS